MKQVVTGAVGLVVWSVIALEYMRLVAIVDMGTVLTMSKTWADQTSASNATLAFPGSSQSTLSSSSSSNYNITAAICHKTLFGNSLNYTRIAEWADYHYKLGFDRIFIGYLPELAAAPGFGQLQALAYVTLYENNLSGPPRKYYTVRLVKHGPGSQDWDIEQCLSHFAKDFDWAMHSDCDEFLWFEEKMNVKEFLHRHEDYNYLSFGKYMYSPVLTPSFLSNDDLTNQPQRRQRTSPKRYSLSDYPFHSGPFCINAKAMPRERGGLYCPDYPGRSKLMVRPTHFSKFLDVHSSLKADPDPAAGQLHLMANIAHLKEWPNMFAANVTHGAKTVPPRDFVVKKDAQQELMMHQFIGARAVNEQGDEIMVQYDSNLDEWLDFVASLRRA